MAIPSLKLIKNGALMAKCTLHESIGETTFDKSYNHPYKEFMKYLLKKRSYQTTLNELSELCSVNLDKRQSVERKPIICFPKNSERYLTKKRNRGLMRSSITYPYYEDSTRYSKTDNRGLTRGLLCNGRNKTHTLKSVTSRSYVKESSHFTNTRRNDHKDSKIKKRNGFTENREKNTFENSVPKDTCHGELESDITTDGCMEDCQKDLTKSLKYENLENPYYETTKTENTIVRGICNFKKEYNNYTKDNVLTNKTNSVQISGLFQRMLAINHRKLAKGRPSSEKGNIHNKRNHLPARKRNKLKHKTTAMAEESSRDEKDEEDSTRNGCHEILQNIPIFHSYNETIVSEHADAYRDPFFTERNSVKNKYSLRKLNSLKQTATLEAVSRNDSSKVTDVSELDNLPCNANRPTTDAYMGTTLEQEPPDDYSNESRDDSESHIGQCNVEVDNESLDTVDVSAWSSNSEHRCPLQDANLGCLPLSELSLASLPADFRHIVFLNLINSLSTQVVKIIKRCQKCIANLDTKECECVTGTGYLLGRSPEIEVPQGSRKGLGCIYIATSNQLVLDNASARNCLVEFSSLHHSFHKGRILRGHSVQHISEAGEINTYLKCKTHDLQLIYKINAIQAEIKTRTDDLPLTIKRRLMKMAFVIGYSHGDCLTLSYSESTMIRRRLVKEVVEGKEQYWLKNIATCSNDNDYSDVHVLLYTAMTCPGCVGAPVLTYQELKSDGKIQLTLNIWTHQGVLKTSGIGCSSIKASTESKLNENVTSHLLPQTQQQDLLATELQRETLQIPRQVGATPSQEELPNRQEQQLHPLQQTETIQTSLSQSTTNTHGELQRNPIEIPEPGLQLPISPCSSSPKEQLQPLQQTQTIQTPISESTTNTHNELQRIPIEIPPHGLQIPISPCSTSPNQQNEINQSLHPPSYPAFITFRTRLRSFVNWPARNIHPEEQLARFGFFYAGYADCVRCYQCALGLRSWKQGDDILVEHKRFRPNCVFLQRLLSTMPDVTGSDVERYHEQTTRHQGVDVQSSEIVDTTSKRILSALTTTSTISGSGDIIVMTATLAPASLPELPTHGSDDFKSQEEHQTSIEESAKTPGMASAQEEENTTQETVLNEGQSMATQDVQTRLLKAENQKLQELMKCKVCRQNPIKSLFLPCGDLYACEDCANKFHQCPLCQRRILGTVTTFFANS